MPKNFCLLEMECIICNESANFNVICCGQFICLQCVLNLECKKCPYCRKDVLKIKDSTGVIYNVPNTRGYTQDDPSDTESVQLLCGLCLVDCERVNTGSFRVWCGYYNVDGTQVDDSIMVEYPTNVCDDCDSKLRKFYSLYSETRFIVHKMKKTFFTEYSEKIDEKSSTG